ncbi:hypothetical protein [Ferrimonas futtsuensis]|uniref:hypothetical protein n=1 Tax=Ferrimonas futtsuensis TaxID=364764 RepID=UPI00048448AD|nr:hypothetical protein [Ferrimonas futtsuensis]
MINNIYHLEYDEDSFAVGFANTQDVRRFRKATLGTDAIASEFDGMELTYDPFSRGHKITHFKDFFVGGLLVVEEGKQELESILNGFGQWIPMKLDSKGVFFFHPTTTLDIVDTCNSELLYHDGYVTGVKKFAFKDFDDNLPPVFKMAGFEHYGLTVSSRFKEYVEASSLTGLSFKKL